MARPNPISDDYDFESDTESESPFSTCNPFKIFRDRIRWRFRKSRTPKYMKECFRFSSLPQEMKNQILDSVDVREALLLLKINQQLRQRILKLGPFPRKIDEIVLNFISKSNPHSLQPFHLRIITRNRYLQDFADDLFWKLGRFFLEKIKTTRILSINKIGISLENHGETMIMFHYRLKLFESFSNLHSISSFRIGGSLNFVGLFLEYFYPNSIEQSMLNLKWNEDEEEENLESILRDQFEKPGFKNCENLLFNGPIGPFWEHFQALNSKLFLNLYNGEWEGFERGLRQFLENGLPSSNPQATAGFRAIMNPNSHLHPGDLWHPTIEGFFMNLRIFISNHSGIEVLEEDSQEIEPIIELLPKIEKFYEILIQGGHLDALKFRAFFKKDLENGQSILYFLTLHHGKQATLWEYFDVQFILKLI